MTSEYALLRRLWQRTVRDNVRGNTSEPKSEPGWTVGRTSYTTIELADKSRVPNKVYSSDSGYGS